MLLTILTFLTTFRMMVIPAQFQDVPFSASEEILRENLQKQIQDCQDYFNKEFVPVSGIDEFLFELAPVITLPQALSFYGSNYSDKKDAQMYQGAREACLLSRNNVNFSDYDIVCIITPGQDEINTGDSSAIYPQYLSLKSFGSSLSIDGNTLDKFVITTELSGIGTLCHELAHHFGLPDFYDVDAEGSDGRAKGLLGTSLMDEGCRRADGNSPPGLNAIELEILGIGVCDSLRLGEYTLVPNSRYFLKGICPNKNEYYLFDCDKDEGLRVYYVDKSENKRGKSTRQNKVLTAAQRWESNEINASPGMECALLLRPESSFSSGSDPAFSFFDGSSSSLALTNIYRDETSGNVSFNIIQPLLLNEVLCFQDAAILRWKCDESIETLSHYEISWVDSDGNLGQDIVPSGSRHYVIEGLKQNTHYDFTIKLIQSDGTTFLLSRNFTTKQLSKGTKAFIYLYSSERNDDGAFFVGSKIPLRIFNAEKGNKCSWYFNSKPATLDRDGNFVVRSSGTLKAVIEYEDGNTETIIKEINL